MHFVHENHALHCVSLIRCWLPSEKGVIFAFIGPMVAIIVVSNIYNIIKFTVQTTYDQKLISTSGLCHLVLMIVQYTY